jgi:hypothetical protein
MILGFTFAWLSPHQKDISIPSPKAYQDLCNLESGMLALPAGTPKIEEATTLEERVPVPVTCAVLRFSHKVPLTFLVIG